MVDKRRVSLAQTLELQRARFTLVDPNGELVNLKRAKCPTLLTYKSYCDSSKDKTKITDFGAWSEVQNMEAYRSPIAEGICLSPLFF